MPARFTRFLGTGYGNTPQLLAVLESDSPTGPFTFVSNRTGSDDPFHTVAAGIHNYPPGYQFADATLFQHPHTHRRVPAHALAGGWRSLPCALWQRSSGRALPGLPFSRTQ